MKKKIERELKKNSYDTYLKEKLKDPRLGRGFEEGVGALKLGYQVYVARKRLGMTQGELARRIGTRQSNVSRLERGEYNFTVEMLQKIAKALSLALHIELASPHRKKAA